MTADRPGRARIPELSNIPWGGPKAITDYAKIGRALVRDLGGEFEMGAEELYAVLIRSFKGHPILALLGAPDVRLRARRVTRRLKRAAELQRGSAVELVKFHQQFRKEFIEQLPSIRDKKKVEFNWDDD
ncbi:hypothetical protein GCM10010517_36450 [Streptosporangium fragile]|uniref:Uncharacterized protein n=1 Tax=Streptosporangium fragile TaxID=46186 RepID=A0ABP6IEE1_9ACTN